MTRKQRELVQRVLRLLKRTYRDDTSGHDWGHLERVWKMAKRLAKDELVSQFLLEMAALLHDVDDYKVKKTGEEEFSRTEKIIAPFGLNEAVKKRLYQVMRSVSFKGARVETTPTTLEGKIVQDADRLDALGAVGIARVFAYGGSAGHP